MKYNLFIEYYSFTDLATMNIPINKLTGFFDRNMILFTYCYLKSFTTPVYNVHL